MVPAGSVVGVTHIMIGTHKDERRVGRDRAGIYVANQSVKGVVMATYLAITSAGAWSDR